MSKQLYVYSWGNTRNAAGQFRQQFKGRLCEILIRGTLNARLVRFIDTGELLNCSGNALRKA